MIIEVGPISLLKFKIIQAKLAQIPNAQLGKHL